MRDKFAEKTGVVLVFLVFPS